MFLTLTVWLLSVYFPQPCISALMFAVVCTTRNVLCSYYCRSLLAIPGLWLLSLCLSGARQRCQGSLSLPIGIRTGIMASCFILKTGGFLTYEPNFPIWLTGTLSFEPFSGIVGLAFTLLLTVVLYPRRQPITGNKVARRAREWTIFNCRWWIGVVFNDAPLIPPRVVLCCVGQASMACLVISECVPLE